MKIKLAAVALVMSAAFCCSDANATDLLGRMLTRGDDAPVASSCCDTPANACCNRGFGFTLHLHFGMNGGLFNRGCGGGCGGGCEQADPCGCGGGLLANRGGGLLSGMFSGCCNDSCENNYVDDCCGRGFPRFQLFSRGCGCEQADPCDKGCGILSSLRGRLAGFGSRGCCDNGCDSGCNNDCGNVCEAGCAGPGLLSSLRGRVGGLRGRLGCCNTGCDTGCAPAKDCGGCDPCARMGVRGRLASLNLRGRLGCCENSGCGCDAVPSEAAEEATDAAAETTSISPTVDPSAFIIRGGRFVRN